MCSEQPGDSGRRVSVPGHQQFGIPFPRVHVSFVPSLVATPDAQNTRSVCPCPHVSTTLSGESLHCPLGVRGSLPEVVPVKNLTFCLESNLCSSVFQLSAQSHSCLMLAAVRQKRVSHLQPLLTERLCPSSPFAGKSTFFMFIAGLPVLSVTAGLLNFFAKRTCRFSKQCA